MFRRCTSLLLIFGYLISQLAVVPHSHGDTVRHGQRSLPHVHLSVWGSDDHAHSHSYGHKHNSTDRTLPDEPTIMPSTMADHDADAIYLCDAVPRVPTKSASGIELNCGRLALAAVAIAGVPVQITTGSTSRFQEHPLGDCARYLQLRTLRI